jgi:hypothetical protein
MRLSRISTSLVVLIVAVLTVVSAGGYYLLANMTGNPKQSQTASQTTTYSDTKQTTFSGVYEWSYPCYGLHGTLCPVGFRQGVGGDDNFTTLLSG